jgi:hypothetical protein
VLNPKGERIRAPGARSTSTDAAAQRERFGRVGGGGGAAGLTTGVTLGYMNR